MQLRYLGLAPKPFASLFRLPMDELETRGIRRMTADDKPGYPCRVTLEDAEPGECVLLLPFEHHPANSPYRATGPIFVREAALSRYDGTELPQFFAGRLLSARAYSVDGMMLEADVSEASEIADLLARQFSAEETAYVHVHFARRGCFACRVERSGEGFRGMDSDRECGG